MKNANAMNNFRHFHPLTCIRHHAMHILLHGFASAKHFGTIYRISLMNISSHILEFLIMEYSFLSNFYKKFERMDHHYCDVAQIRDMKIMAAFGATMKNVAIH